MIDTSFDVDLSLLVGPMDELECEHRQHGQAYTAHGGKATHYVRGNHEQCGYHGEVKAACGPYVEYVQMDVWLRCPSCRFNVHAYETEILGPVGG
jgi:hypothetical protein